MVMDADEARAVPGELDLLREVMTTRRQGTAGYRGLSISDTRSATRCNSSLLIGHSGIIILLLWIRIVGPLKA